MAKDEQTRRMGRNFASLRATFSRSTPPATEIPIKVQPQKKPEDVIKTPAPPSTAERRQSKYTLFDLFSKPKVQTARGYHESGLENVTEDVVVSSTTFYNKPNQVNDTSNPRPRPHMPSATASHESYVQIPQPKVPTATEYWDAPPLFQAYPQSVKHQELKTPGVSIESLARTQNLRKQIGVFGSTTSLPVVNEDSGDMGVGDGAKILSKRYSTINETPELVPKVFVLVTAGRLVQYAGDGNYDRMPERVLQLGERSAAFVCDLVPGKHWVVQVVQQINVHGGSQINKSRSILSRLRMPAASRKAATGFLLVFNSAEDMTDWLQAIKEVIEQFGGTKREDAAEAQIPKPKTAEKPVEDQLSHRYRVSRPPSMISPTIANDRPRSASSVSRPKSPRSPLDMVFPSVPSAKHLSPYSTPGNSPRDSKFPPEIQSLVGAATESPSIGPSIASSDQVQLDKLRGDSRDSVASAGTAQSVETDNVTVPSSAASSSPPSPKIPDFPERSRDSRLIPLRTSYIAPIGGARRFSVQPGVGIGPAPVAEAPDLLERSETPLKERANSSPDVRVFPLSTSYKPTVNQETVPPARRSPELMQDWSKSGRPDSFVGALPDISARPLSRLDSSRRQRPLSRILPVRPQEPTAVRASGPRPHSRRVSSLPSELVGSSTIGSSSPPISENSSTTTPTSTHTTSPDTSRAGSAPPSHRARTPSYGRIPISHSVPPPQKTLRRPTSLQVRSSPAPFLSRRQPSLTLLPSDSPSARNSYFAGSSPSNNFLLGRPAPDAQRITDPTLPSIIPETEPESKPATAEDQVLPASLLLGEQEFGSESDPKAANGLSAPPIPPMNPNRLAVRARVPLPAMSMGLPPPPPPPNMPLPSLPPNIPLPQPPIVVTATQ